MVENTRNTLIPSSNMIARLGFVAILALCVAQLQAASLPGKLVEPSATRVWSDYDHEHGQYSMAVLSTETTVLRYKVYVFNLEVSHTIKYMDKDIIAKFNAIGTDPVLVTDLENEFNKRSDNISTSLQRIMNHTSEFSDLCGTINGDIANNVTSRISFDQIILKNQFESFNTIYDLSMQNVRLAATLVKNKLIATIGSETGPEIEEIKTIGNNAETLFYEHETRCNDAKLLMSTAYTVGDAALVQLVATAPPVAK